VDCYSTLEAVITKIGTYQLQYSHPHHSTDDNILLPPEHITPTRTYYSNFHPSSHFRTPQALQSVQIALSVLLLSHLKQNRPTRVILLNSYSNVLLTSFSLNILHFDPLYMLACSFVVSFRTNKCTFRINNKPNNAPKWSIDATRCSVVLFIQATV